MVPISSACGPTSPLFHPFFLASLIPCVLTFLSLFLHIFFFPVPTESSRRNANWKGLCRSEFIIIVPLTMLATTLPAAPKDILIACINKGFIPPLTYFQRITCWVWSRKRKHIWQKEQLKIIDYKLDFIKFSLEYESQTFRAWHNSRGSERRSTQTCCLDLCRLIFRNLLNITF